MPKDITNPSEVIENLHPKQSDQLAPKEPMLSDESHQATDFFKNIGRNVPEIKSAWDEAQERGVDFEQQVEG